MEKEGCFFRLLRVLLPTLCLAGALVLAYMLLSMGFPSHQERLMLRMREESQVVADLAVQQRSGNTSGHSVDFLMGYLRKAVELRPAMLLDNPLAAPVSQCASVQCQQQQHGEQQEQRKQQGQQVEQEQQEEAQQQAQQREMLRRLWSYQPLLPQDSIVRGLSQYGDGERLQAFAAKLAAGQPVGVVTLGGSITHGKGGIHGGPYALRFLRWLNATWPRPQGAPPHRLANRGLPATPSNIFAVCVDRLVPQDTDLVVVETAVNDAFQSPIDGPDRRAFEQLLRKLLRLPSRPAVAVLMAYAYRPSQQLFYPTAENDMLVFSQYYSLPVLSVRSAVYPYFKQNRPGFQADRDYWSKGKRSEGQIFYLDAYHPLDKTGHRVMADLLISLVRVAVMGAVAGVPPVQPAWPQDGLPEPMIPGNWEMEGTTCIMQEDFKGAVSNTKGFRYQPAKPEAKGFMQQKWGWSSSTPGHWVELEVNTLQQTAGRAAASGAAAGAAVGKPAAGKRAAGAAAAVTAGEGGAVAAMAAAATPAAKVGAAAPTNSCGSRNGQASGGCSPAQKTWVMLSYLRSWQPMGRALVECRSGCSCKPTVMHGHWSEKTTQADLHGFNATQAARCLLRVTVLAPEEKKRQQQGGGPDISMVPPEEKKKGQKQGGGPDRGKIDSSSGGSSSSSSSSREARGSSGEGRGKPAWVASQGGKQLEKEVPAAKASTGKVGKSGGSGSGSGGGSEGDKGSRVHLMGVMVASVGGGTAARGHLNSVGSLAEAYGK